MAIRSDYSNFLARFFQTGIRGTAALLSSTHPEEKRFHESRKRLKEVRAVLRLSRIALGDLQYVRENTAMRDVARGLSPLRDAHVVGETLATLLREPGARIKPAEAEVLLGMVKRYQAGVARRESAKRNVTAEAVRQLTLIQKRMAGITLVAVPPALLERSLRRTYRQGLRRFAGSYRSRTDHDFHEWRKSVKHLRHQLQLLASASGRKFPTLDARLKRLADQLGLDHDCAVLREILQRSRLARTAAVRKACAALTRKQNRLRISARQLARQLFSREPRAFSAAVFRAGGHGQ